MMTIIITAYPVDGCNIALVFNCPRFQQCIPVVDPRSWPVCTHDHQVISGVVAAPDRKPEIITYDRHDLPAFYFNDQMFLTRGVMEILFTKGEEMSLVIVFDLTLRENAVPPVVVCSSILYGYATGNCEVKLL